MVIHVDSREKYIDRIKDLLVDMPISEVENCPEFKFHCLDLGDYHLENGNASLRVERKSISDFMGSYPLLKERLAKMRLVYDRTALLLEGVYSLQNGRVCVAEGNQMVPRMDYTTYTNFLTHQAALGTWIFHTMTFEESIYRLIRIHNYLPKLDAPTPSFKIGSVAEWLVMLPGVGSETAKKLKYKHDNPLAAINDGLPKKAKEMLAKW